MRKQKASPQQKTYRTAAYLRVSTDDQDLGMAVQRHRVEAMCAVKDWPMPALYEDDGISGTLPIAKRPALQRLLADVQAGNIDAVIILALDRLGRRTRLVLDIVDTLAQRGVALVSCKENLDTSTPTGAFVLTLLAALTQLERDTISERTKAALEARSRDKGDAGGSMPYGYVRVAEGVTVDAEKAAHVKYIFNARHRGDTLRDIAGKLNGRGVAAPRGGSVWYAATVREVLSNKAAYTGHARGLSSIPWPRILAV